ncbi:MAG: hypothetical protein GY928_33555 [Colwellia sp.]|nr:hypothetical protein [Colwellia sp.]
MIKKEVIIIAVESEESCRECIFNCEDIECSISGDQMDLPNCVDGYIYTIKDN